MISVDGSLWIQMINFLVLIWVMNLVLYKPIRKILQQRKEKISGVVESIEDLNLQAEESETAYGAGVKKARVEGLKEKEALIEAASQEEKQILDEINRKSQARLVEIREKVANEAEAARKSLEKEIDVFAKAIGHKILGRAVK